MSRSLDGRIAKVEERDAPVRDVREGRIVMLWVWGTTDAEIACEIEEMRGDGRLGPHDTLMQARWADHEEEVARRQTRKHDRKKACSREDGCGYRFSEQILLKQ